MRLIVAKTAKANVDELIIGSSNFAQDMRAACYQAIDDAPTVDAAPVVHGRWIEIRNGKGELDGWIHTRCGRSTFEASPYCPKCGAKMEWEVQL